MNTIQKIDPQIYKTLHEPLQQLPRTCLFTNTQLFKSKDNKVIKKKEFKSKKEYRTWEKSINQELKNQWILSSKYPTKVLPILNYTYETINHLKNLYITYDCEDDIEPLYQYLNNNSVNFQDQAQIFEQLLQITCILFQSQFEHTNLKPNNILYYKKQVLITDFGSARTHYQNFIVQYTKQAEKEWQNNLIFFYPQEYQKIMEDNIDFRDDQWNNFDISNQNFRKSIDIWALSMMMIQVFENNQILPNKLSDFYGLNTQLLLKKIENLKQYSDGIFAKAIHSLIIERQEPEQVYQQFIQQKQMIKLDTTFTESAFTIKQIFDRQNDDNNNNYSSFKPENYFLTKNKIEDLEGQFDDDRSSVISANYQNDAIGFTEIRQTNNLIPVPNLIPPKRIQSANARQKPQNQLYQFPQNNQQIFEFEDNKQNNERKKTTIIVSNYDFIEQQNQGNKYEDPIQNNNNRPNSFDPILQEFQIKHENNNQVPLTEIPEVINDQNLTKQLNNQNLQTGVLQIIQLQEIDDDYTELKKDPNNNQQKFNQNESQNLKFLGSQMLNTFNEKDNYQKKVDKNNQFQNFQYQNIQNQDLINFEDQQLDQIQIEKFVEQQQQQQQTHQQQINIISISDFNGEDPNKIPNVNPQNQVLFQSGNIGIQLEKLNDPENKIPDLKFIPQKEKFEEEKRQLLKSQDIQDNLNVSQQQYRSSQLIYDHEEDQKLIQISENDDQIDQINQNNNKSKKQSIIHIIGSDMLPIQPISNGEEIIGQQNKNNPFTIDEIKKIINNGVTQLEDQEQKQVLEQLKLIQKILNQVIQHITDPQEIFDKDDKYKQNQRQIDQIISDLVKQNEKQQLTLIKDINDGVEAITENQKVFQNLDLIQNNPISLRKLNEYQLNQVRQRYQGNKLITDQIDKLIQVKNDLTKLKTQPIIKNLLQKQQIELLNKEELKIYQAILDIIPKDKRQGGKIFEQQNIVENLLKQIRRMEEKKLVKEKLDLFLQDPIFDKLLRNNDLLLLDDDEKQQYLEAVKKLQLQVQQRQKKSIQEQIDIIEKDTKKTPEKDKPKVIPIQQQDPILLDQKFQDAYIHMRGKLSENDNGEVLSFNKYIKEFQLNSASYQITDQIPQDCLKYQQQSTQRVVRFYDFQGQKYKGETLNDQPDGIGILRKQGVSSIYKGIFKQGKFLWGQVLEMNDEGQLTQYVGYYHQQYQVKNGKARLKWYQPYQLGFCGGYQFNDYEYYEGDFVLGYIHGKGKKRYSDFSEYHGEWKKNKRDGQGKYTLVKNGKKSITYEGQFRDDQQHGKDVKAIHHHKTELDLVVKGEYRNGKPIGQHLLIFNNIPQRQIDY